MSSVYSSFGTKQTPQSEPILGKKMIENNAGGFVYELDQWKALERFLILGSESGTYYVNERKLTKDNAERVMACIQQNGPKAIEMIVDVSHSGRAPKNDHAIFALAMAASDSNVKTRQAALDALPKVCRIPTHLFHFITYLKNFRGVGGRAVKRAIGKWYNAMPVDKLAYEVVKYQSRDGWSNADVLRQAHPKVYDKDRNAIYRWIVDGMEGLEKYSMPVPDIIMGFETAKKTDNPEELVTLIQKFNLSREMVPTEALNHVVVWEALLEKMPYTAMIRNLGNMSKVGLLKPLSSASKFIVERLHDEAAIQKARIHPIAILMALKTYEQGHGMLGKGKWDVTGSVVAALDDAFYLAFKYLEPTGKSFLIGVDCSGSMTAARIANIPMSAAEGAAAMAMACIRSEKDYHVICFDNKVRKVPSLNTKMSLAEVYKQTANLSGSGTDCAVPMVWATDQKVSPDVVVTITDNETWAGNTHVSQALAKLRQQSGIKVKSVVIGMTATNMTVND